MIFYAHFLSLSDLVCPGARPERREDKRAAGKAECREAAGVKGGQG